MIPCIFWGLHKDVTMSEEYDSEIHTDQPDFPVQPSDTSSVYQSAVEHMRAENYETAIELFEQNAEQHGETSPDTHRDLGWCHYRMGEDLLFRTESKAGLARLAQGREHYRQAEAGFQKLREQHRDPELQKRIDHRIIDCQKRLTLIGGLGEHLQHKVEFFRKEKERAVE